jgi:hypothetical protein
MAAQGRLAHGNEPIGLQRTLLNKSYTLDLTSLGLVLALHNHAEEQPCLMQDVLLA